MNDKKQIRCCISFHSNSSKLLRIIKKAISPENSLLDKNSEIHIFRGKNILNINILSSCNLSSIRYIVDDLLFTTGLIERVYDSDVASTTLS